MKKNWVAIILFSVPAFFPLTSLAAESSSLFAQANAKYAAGDFKAAASLYQEIVDSKEATAAVYYNLGNADLRLGKKGLALICYERALKVSPRDKDLRWNLNVLRTALPDRIEEGDVNFVVSFLRKTVGFVTVDELGLLLAAALGLLAGLAILRFFLPSSRLWTRPLRGLLWVLVVTSAILFLFKWTRIRDPRVVVLQGQVYAHYGPSDKETKAFLLHEGAEGRVMDESKGWYYILLKNKNTGWIPKESCEVV